LFVFLTAPISAHLLVKAALALDPRARPEPPQGEAPTVRPRRHGKASVQR
jgi:hypothetical protein